MIQCVRVLVVVVASVQVIPMRIGDFLAAYEAGTAVHCRCVMLSPRGLVWVGRAWYPHRYLACCTSCPPLHGYIPS